MRIAIEDEGRIISPLDEIGMDLRLTSGDGSGRVRSADATLGGSVCGAAVAFTKALADLGRTGDVQSSTNLPTFMKTERFWRRIKADVEPPGRSESEVREWRRQDINV